MRASRGLKWENKMYKLKRSISNKTIEVVIEVIKGVLITHKDYVC